MTFFKHKAYLIFESAFLYSLYFTLQERFVQKAAEITRERSEISHQEKAGICSLTFYDFFRRTVSQSSFSSAFFSYSFAGFQKSSCQA